MAPLSFLLALGAFTTVLSTRIAAAAANDVPGTTSMRFGRIAERYNIYKRAPSPHSVTIGNAEALYYVNATVGSDNQQIVLQLDTGSSDVWMFGPQACDTECQESGVGYYDPSKSSTYHLLDQGGFKIEYVTPGSGVVGNYFTDTFKLPGLTISNLTMAYATSASAVETGIMGIGFANDESIVSDGSQPYQSIIDQMVNEGLISSHSYSLWLDDNNADYGTILFGGYDSSKYTGDLTVLQLQPEAGSNVITSFTVVWSMFAVTDSSGSTIVDSTQFPLAAVLDSGTSLMAVPQSLYTSLVGYFGVISSEELGDVLPCKVANWTGSLDFGFGGSDGPIIQVPFSEITIPIYFEDGSVPQFDNGDAACTFGIQPSPDAGIWLLGDTFLRSAYVVYDLDAQQVAIAQANWNSNAPSNVKAISSGTALASAISAKTIASPASVTQSLGTAQVAPGHSATVTAMTDSPQTANTASVSHISGIKTTLSLAPVTGAGGGAAAANTQSPGSSPTTGAALAAVPDVRAQSSWVVYAVVAMGLLAGAMVMVPVA